jgi:hypothetical protein
MARKRVSLKDKGEEILGLKRSGEGADILFGGGSGRKPVDTSPGSPAPGEALEEEGLPRAEAGLDEELSGEVPMAMGGLPREEADLDEQDLERMLSAEAQGAEGAPGSPEMAASPAAIEEMPQAEADLGGEDMPAGFWAETEVPDGNGGLPELATTPAAPGPPPLEPITPPPMVTRPLPAPPPIMPSPGGTTGGAVAATARPVPTAPPPRVASAPAPRVQPAAPPPSFSPAATSPPPASPAAEVPPPDNARPSPTPAVAPPSTASGAPDLSVPRPLRYVRMVGEDFDLLAEERSRDATGAVLIGVPQSADLTPDQRAALLRSPAVREQLAQVNKAIYGQYDRILSQNASVNPDITDWAHNMLAEARTIVLYGQVEKLARAEWNVEQVRARLDRAAESERQARRYAWPILLWGLSWFLFLAYILFKPSLVLQWINLGDVQDVLLNPDVFLQALFFGGIGGVAAVFYHLFKYLRERSFDSQYVLSYFGKPIMGMIMGSIVYLTMFGARFVSVAVFQGQVPDSDLSGLRYIIYLVAVYASFKENLVFDLLNKVIKAVLGSEEEVEEAAPPRPPSPAVMA